MCIAASVNFAASACIAAVGVLTLSRVSQPRTTLFATIPLLFALHQFAEGFVWLGADGVIRPDAEGHLVFLFILYAQGILPLLMPFAVLLMEPPGKRRVIVAVLTLLGGAECAYVMYALVQYPSTAIVEHHSLAYRNPGTETFWVAGVYIVVTCGALIASTHKVVRWFGLLNLVGVIATLVMARWAFTSIWCLYAAIVSCVLLWQFWNKHINVARPNVDLDEGREPRLA